MLHLLRGKSCNRLIGMSSDSVSDMTFSSAGILRDHIYSILAICRAILYIICLRPSDNWSTNLNASFCSILLHTDVEISTHRLLTPIPVINWPAGSCIRILIGDLSHNSSSFSPPSVASFQSFICWRRSNLSPVGRFNIILYGKISQSPEGAKSVFISFQSLWDLVAV